MIKTLRNLLKQDKERFVVPRGVQDVIPIKAIYDDGIFQVGRDKFSKTYKFSDINYAVASREDKEAMFLEYSELLNSLDSGATTKITINNRRLNRANFEKTILLPLKGDALDEYREEYNRMLLDKATGANAIIQEKYITISVCKKNVEEARNYFARVGADLIAHFGRLGSKCVELEPDERLRIFHDFYRAGEETEFRFDIKETRRKGHDFKDFICPDSMEFTGDYFKIGERYGRVLFLREYASYIKDSMVAEMTDLNRNLMMSIDVIQLPYVIKTEARRQQAELRRQDIENQLASSKYGVAYTDGTEHVVQLNRPVENNLMSQIEYLTSMLYSQLGLTQGILDGSADDKTMQNYLTRIVEPILSAIVDEIKRKFLTKTARSQKQSILFFRDPFKLVPVDKIAEMTDKFTRNEVMTSNEIRQKIGMKPSSDPKADELRNSNLSAPAESTPASTPKEDNNQNGEET